MKVVITGGAGFIGARLARALLSAGTVAVDGAAPVGIDRLALLDKVVPPADLVADPRVDVVTGDLPDTVAAIAGADLIYHLAAAVSAECEADFDLGLEANLKAGYALFEAARALPAPALLVFASSLAVYGGWPGQPMPDVVTDSTLPMPRSSYGTQKFILEQLLTDYTRKGFVRGRPVRLMTVTVRPGRPNRAATGFLSGIIREPLNGVRAVCPVPADTAVAVSSPARTIDGLIRVAAAGAQEYGPPVGLNLPALSTTVADMVVALTEVAGPEVAGLIDWRPDPAVEELVRGWAPRVEAPRAHALGLHPDPDFATIIRAYRAENVSG